MVLVPELYVIIIASALLSPSRSSTRFPLIFPEIIDLFHNRVTSPVIVIGLADALFIPPIRINIETKVNKNMTFPFEFFILPPHTLFENVSNPVLHAHPSNSGSPLGLSSCHWQKI